jgi:ABC-type phosphate transport system ATPase subunit
MSPKKIVVRNLSLARNDAAVLDNVCLEARSGQIIGLLGPSGSGKSTLLRCVNRLLEPPPQTVFVDELDVTAVNVLELRRRVGMVFQQPIAFPGTVADNLRFGPALQDRTLGDDEIEVLLDLAALDRSLLDKQASELSGGQAQRVALARCLTNRPEVLLMDEPTSALDPASRRRIEEMIIEEAREHGVTVMWVTHAIEQARKVADYLYLLVDGHIVDQGKPEHVLSDQIDNAHLMQQFAAGELEGNEHV